MNIDELAWIITGIAGIYATIKTMSYAILIAHHIMKHSDE